jgi:multidrug resistance efflux pump
VESDKTVVRAPGDGYVTNVGLRKGRASPACRSRR